MRTFTLFLLLTGVLLVPATAVPLALDHVADSELQIRLDGLIQNPLVGFRGELEWKSRSLGLDLIGGGGWGCFPGLETTSVPLLGANGYSAHGSLGLLLGQSVEEVRTFFAEREVGRSGNTVTYEGFYYGRPEHTFHWLDLACLLEPTGMLAEVGRTATNKPVYDIVDGSTLFLNPRYRIAIESRYSLPGYISSPEGYFTTGSFGPLVTPDLSKVGGALELMFGFNGPSANLLIGAQLGWVVRRGLPSQGVWKATSDPADGSLDVLGPAKNDGLLWGAYLPIGLGIGIAYNLPFAKGAQE